MGLEALLHRQPPSSWSQFWASPLRFSARSIYHAFSPTLPVLHRGSQIRVVCISDTHNCHHALPPLPSGDILIHCGDLTQSGTMKEMCNALSWMQSQPHQYKIYIAGNHDTCLVDSACRSILQSSYPNLIYLEDSMASLTIRGRKLLIYGSPQTPKHGSWVFQYPRVHSTRRITTEDVTNPWASVPQGVDILITHGPPAFHLDRDCGCPALLDELWRIRPVLHVFGHIHAGRGVECVAWGRDQAAYEAAMIGSMNPLPIWWNLLLGLWGMIGRIAQRALEKLGRVKQRSAYDETIFVNAASVSGLRDEARNEGIVVDI